MGMGWWCRMMCGCWGVMHSRLWCETGADDSCYFLVLVLFFYPCSFLTPFYRKPWWLLLITSFLSLGGGVPYVGISIAWDERCQYQDWGGAVGGKGRVRCSRSFKVFLCSPIFSQSFSRSSLFTILAHHGPLGGRTHHQSFSYVGKGGKQENRHEFVTNMLGAWDGSRDH
ncbi:hypothetical protein F5144DRAFT_579083 [Chaetomium tenue]|uniref:Uncharacterized protein n=1 Tax=Chaetomium tenue TaxID=1854479 RepID=A0ACB7P3B5_9PEZI|nr:hypothetical protein F5144DRAFT_579083 [Chaetomium globosum]